MVVGKPIWEIIKEVERIETIVRVRVHVKKITDKHTGEWIDFKFSQSLLKSDAHPLFLSQGVKCDKREEIKLRVDEDLSMGDYYVVDLTYDTILDKELNEHYQNALTLLV